MVSKKKQFVIAVKIQMVGLRCSAVTHDPDPGPNRLRAPKLTSSSSRLYGTISMFSSNQIGLSAPTNRIKTDVQTAHLTNLRT